MSYGLLPANVRHDKVLGDKAKLLYAEITASTDAQGYCTKTNDKFAECMGTTPRTVARALDELLKAAYITKSFTPHRLRRLSASLANEVPKVEEIKVVPKKEEELTMTQTFETLLRYWESSLSVVIPKDKVKLCNKLYHERKKTFNDLELIRAIQSRIAYLAQSEYHNRPDNKGVFYEMEIVLVTDTAVSQWIKLA